MFALHAPKSTAARRWAWISAVVLCGTALAGCGGGAPFDIIPVTGKVTYEDGSPIPADRVRVVFTPMVEATPAGQSPRPGEAEVNEADGTFESVTTWKYNDGLIPGKHKVQVISLDDQEMETDAVPEAYRRFETTPLEIEVSNQNRKIELQVPKP